VETARGCGGGKVIELRDPQPTPGKGRNAGIRNASHGLIQFLDADTVLNPAWFRIALPLMRGDVGAVAGQLKERCPDRNLYNVIVNMEWGISAGRKGHVFREGPAQIFGGIVLMRKDALERVSGYDPSLVAGEDPDLSYRIRREGWTIYRTTSEMVTHDINLSPMGQYMKRAVRSGHAYAEIGLRYRRESEKFFLRQLLRIVTGAIAPVSVLVLGIALKRSVCGLALASALAFRSMRKVPDFMPGRGLGIALMYCLHLSLVVYPQFFGVIRYLWGLVSGRPLRNRGYARGEEAS
jgi:cellulose synthase/poly-beta-1,6-N-acetylglucosamine synthase-like glycosyltransferase